MRITDSERELSAPGSRTSVLKGSDDQVTNVTAQGEDGSEEKANKGWGDREKIKDRGGQGRGQERAEMKRYN